MRVLILTSLVVTVILTFSTANAEEDNDIHIHFHLTPGDGKPEEDRAKKDGADYIDGGRTETQDTDVQSEGLMNQQDGIRTELDGNRWKTKADGSKGKIKADGRKGKKMGADYCWPWWMCPM